MELLCCFIFVVILVIGVKSFVQKVQGSMGHGESDGTDGTNESEDLRSRQAERLAERLSKRRLGEYQREAKKQRDLPPEPPTLAEIKAKQEEKKYQPRANTGLNVLNPEKQKTTKPTESKQMQEELEQERFEIEKPEIEDAFDEDLVSTEQVIETPESDPGVDAVEAAPLPEVPVPVSPEDTGEQDEGVDEQDGDVDDVEVIEQSSPEDEPTDDASIKVESFCETCMGEEVVTYDSEQIFKDQFQGQPVAWNGLLKSIDPLGYDRYFRAENGFLATLEIYVIKGRYDSRPVLAVVLLAPEQKASWESSLNQEMTFRGTLFALDAFGRKVYVTLRD